MSISKTCNTISESKKLRILYSLTLLLSLLKNVCKTQTKPPPKPISTVPTKNKIFSLKIKCPNMPNQIDRDFY